MRLQLVLTCILIVSWAATARSAVPYAGEPDWTSVENSDYGTGCAFGDVNGDGYPDLAVSNGNDIIEAPNYVYLNSGGALPHAATWISDDARYSGHCELADLNGDGYPELMVANYISTDWGLAQVQLYANTAGALATTPSWESANAMHTFRGSFGDADGDGDLDLAVATGESYTAVYQPNYIYFNVAGTLQTTPGWTSADSNACYDVQFVDIDADGDLDLAFLVGGGPVKIYYNDGTTIATSPGWQTAESDNGNTFDFADLDGDGFLDLGVANNSQLGGSGQFKIYLSNQGTLHTTPDWVSSASGYGSAAVFADIDGDNDADFITGQWWGLIHIYLNSGGTFAATADWTSSPTYESVVEAIVFADVDNGHEREIIRTFAGDGQRKLFYLGDRHLHGIDLVVSDGVPLPATAYCYHLKNGWVSLASAPAFSVEIRYRHSRAKDMAVSNWDTSTYLFYHDEVTAVGEETVAVDLTSGTPLAYPNPFNARTTFAYHLHSAAHVKLDIFDLRGRRVRTLVNALLPSGQQTVTWDAAGAPSGLYFYRLRTGDDLRTGKVYLVK